MNRRPLVKFDTGDHAQLVSGPSMSTVSRGRGKGRAKGKKKSTKRRPSTKVRVIKGRLNLRVAGYKGIQKLAPSSVIPYIPLTKLRAAAKKVLGKSNKKKRRVSRRKTSKRRRSRRKVVA